jgi:predicted Rossmann-fold nucleotide-binding protein
MNKPEPEIKLRPAPVDTDVTPHGTLDLLSQREVEQLRRTNDSRTLELFRRCALAVLNTGNESDDAAEIFDAYQDFRIEIVQRTRGLKLTIKNAPASAFVDGRMVEGIRQHLFAVLRDLVYIGTEIENQSRFDLSTSEGITDAIFHILKQAHVLVPEMKPNLVVCWGGHAISRVEYEYTKEVGYHLGLRGLDICTGCGPGAMKGPMKGAAIGHVKQRKSDARYVGLTEPGIIAAEPPNPMVNHLVVLPDIEKRLEAFARMGHGIVVFPGGVGTAEEVLYLFGLLMDPANAEQKFPVIFTGPASSAAYFDSLDQLIRLTFGDDVRHLYRIIVGDAQSAAQWIGRKIRKVQGQRRSSGDAFYFNWLLKVPMSAQQPFVVTHASVAALQLRREMAAPDLAFNLRRAFSAIVTGNVKDHGIRMIREHGPFVLHGDRDIMNALEKVLGEFIAQGRMKLPGAHYRSCFTLAAD